MYVRKFGAQSLQLDALSEAFYIQDFFYEEMATFREPSGRFCVVDNL